MEAVPETDIFAVGFKDITATIMNTKLKNNC
jgi:hypothetical protein